MLIKNGNVLNFQAGGFVRQGEIKKSPEKFVELELLMEK